MMGLILLCSHVVMGSRKWCSWLHFNHISSHKMPYLVWCDKLSCTHQLKHLCYQMNGKDLTRHTTRNHVDATNVFVCRMHLPMVAFATKIGIQMKLIIGIIMWGFNLHFKKCLLHKWFFWSNFQQKYVLMCWIWF